MRLSQICFCAWCRFQWEKCLVASNFALRCAPARGILFFIFFSHLFSSFLIFSHLFSPFLCSPLSLPVFSVKLQQHPATRLFSDTCRHAAGTMWTGAHQERDSLASEAWVRSGARWWPFPPHAYAHTENATGYDTYYDYCILLLFLL